MRNSITTQSNPSTTYAARQLSQNTNELVNKSAYATVAPSLHQGPASASKFYVPFDEGPTMSTLDNIVEQVESIPLDVQKERGYQILGKVKTTEERLLEILSLADKRVWL